MPKLYASHRYYNVHKIGSKLVNQKNLLDSADILLKLLKDISSNAHTNLRIIGELYFYFKFINNTVIDKCSRNYGIVQDDSTCIALYWYTVWPTKQDHMDCISDLHNEVGKIKKSFKATISKDRISPIEIEEVVRHLDRRFQFGSVLLKDNPLLICLMGCTHKEFSGLYSATQMQDGNIEDLLVMPCKNEFLEFSQKFIFLHELGHMLHFRMTHDLQQLPLSFYELLDLINAGRPRPEAEMFADFFAVAALYNSPMEIDILPFQISEAAKEAILNYFLMCIQQHNMTVRGRLSFEQLRAIHQRSFPIGENR